MAEGGEAKRRMDRRARGGAEDDKPDHWIKSAIKHPGSLRKALHVKAGETIPAKKLARAAHSSNTRLKRKAVLAENLKKMHH